jgi:hypothetical protein
VKGPTPFSADGEVDAPPGPTHGHDEEEEGGDKIGGSSGQADDLNFNFNFSEEGPGKSDVMADDEADVVLTADAPTDEHEKRCVCVCVLSCVCGCALSCVCVCARVSNCVHVLQPPRAPLT